MDDFEAWEDLGKGMDRWVRFGAPALRQSQIDRDRHQIEYARMMAGVQMLTPSVQGFTPGVFGYTGANLLLGPWV